MNNCFKTSKIYIKLQVIKSINKEHVRGPHLYCIVLYSIKNKIETIKKTNKKHKKSEMRKNEKKSCQFKI